MLNIFVVYRSKSTVTVAKASIGRDQLQELKKNIVKSELAKHIL